MQQVVRRIAIGWGESNYQSILVNDVQDEDSKFNQQHSPASSTHRGAATVSGLDLDNNPTNRPRLDLTETVHSSLTIA